MYRYLTSEKCAPAYLTNRDTPYTYRSWLHALLHMCPRKDLITALTIADRTGPDRAAGAGRQKLAVWTDYVMGAVEPDLEQEPSDGEAVLSEQTCNLMDGVQGEGSVYTAGQPKAGN